MVWNGMKRDYEKNENNEINENFRLFRYFRFFRNLSFVLLVFCLLHTKETIMSFFHRRQILQSGIVALANFVIGDPLSKEVQVETRRGIFDAHLHIPSDNGENFQWNLVTRNMPEFVAYLDKCGVRRGVISSSWSNKANTPEDYRNGNREVAKYVDRYKGRFRGSCVITPFRIDEALREIEHCHKEFGFIWLGEFCNYMTGYKYDTNEWAEVMKLATGLTWFCRSTPRRAKCAT
jgi:hypothetical protein